MKVVVLVIASEGDAYNEFLENWRSQQLPENYSVRYLFCSNEHPNPVELRGDCVYVRGRECVKPGIFYKTLAAIENLLSEPFDYLVRTNLSSYINFRKLTTFLKDKPRTNCAAGTYFIGGFLSGSGYILSRDLTTDFLSWWDDECNINPTLHYDDEIVGAFIKERQPSFYTMNGVTYDKSMPFEDTANMLHVRFKTSCDQAERKDDTGQHAAVIDIYNKATRPKFRYILTSSILNAERERIYVEQINRSVNSIRNSMGDTPYSIYLVENNGERRTVFDDISGVALSYTSTNAIACFYHKKGIKEFRDICFLGDKYEFNDEDIIIKLTGMYTIDNPSSFIQFVKDNIDKYDSFMKWVDITDPVPNRYIYDDCCLGLWALRYKYLKEFNYLEMLNHSSMEHIFAKYVREAVPADRVAELEYLGVFWHNIELIA